MQRSVNTNVLKPADGNNSGKDEVASGMSLLLNFTLALKNLKQKLTFLKRPKGSCAVMCLSTRFFLA